VLSTNFGHRRCLFGWLQCSGCRHSLPVPGFTVSGIKQSLANLENLRTQRPVSKPLRSSSFDRQRSHSHLVSTRWMSAARCVELALSTLKRHLLP
jgi:hypothetical protein